MRAVLTRISIFVINHILRDLDITKYFYTSFPFGTCLSNLYVETWHNTWRTSYNCQLISEPVA